MHRVLQGCSWRAGRRCCGPRSRCSRRCWTGGGSSSWPATWRSRPRRSGWRRSGRSPGMRMRLRGRGRRRCSMSGWVTCGRSGGCGGPRSAATRWRSRRSAGISPTRRMGGRRSARCGSAPIRCRSAMSGTPRCTSSRPRVTRSSGRSPSMSCRRSSTTPMSRSAGSAAGPQGLAAGVPGRGDIQGRLRVRAAPHRGPDARPG